jgi:hypothetical protein
MEHKNGRLTKQVKDAIELLYEEGTIIIPMNNPQYEEVKDYKFTVLEAVHEIQRNINTQAQMRLYEAIKDKLKGKNVRFIPDEGVIRLK